MIEPRTADRAGLIERSGVRRIGADLLLGLAAVVAAACSYSTTGRFYNQIAILLASIVLVTVIVTGWRPRVHRATVVLVVAIAVFVQLYKPPKGNVDRHGGFWWVIAVTALATVLIAVLAFWASRSAGAWLTLCGVLGLAVLGIVATSGSPQIDVWQIFQQSSATLFHGVNPYQITDFTGIPHGQTADCFNYLPATFLSTWPGWFVLHDARYSEVAVLLAGWAVLARTLVRRGRDPVPALMLLAVALSLTGTLRVGQQAWNESLLLGFVLIAVCAAATGRTVWLVLALGLALATKQHMGLLLPVLVMWPQLGWRRTGWSVAVAAVVSAPWVLWDPRRFKACTVDFFTKGIARFDSISLWHFVPKAIAPVVIVLAILAAYYLVYRWVPRDLGGLLIACAVVLFAFDLFNKQSFENQWWFACELIVCGLALQVAGLPGSAAGRDGAASQLTQAG
ncbi:MAG TPA: hypothetical protein VHO01_01895 [Jatrophihabitans sp.]|nr:hypothetical protein [Jatrophihabitans sp.]